MTTAHSCRPSSSSFLQLFYTIVALVLSLFVETSHGQGGGCSNTCPPLNYGTPVPALCEGDDLTAFPDIHQKEYSICHGGSGETNTDTFSFDSLQGKIRVVANYYTGCNAGRRESGVFAHVAQRFYNQYPDSVVFIQSVKGGGTCDQWASLFQRDAARLYPDSPDVVPKEMPLSVNDVNYEIRDDLFTAPFGHPAYVILDADGIVRHKFIGPCCGYESYYDCTTSIAKGLDDQLTEYLEPLLMEMSAVEADDKDDETNDNDNTEEEEKPCSSSNSANNANWSKWSPCSIRCGRAADGIQFRYTLPSEEGEDAQQSSCDDDNTKTPPLQTRTCPGGSIPLNCDDNNNDDCIKEFGETWNVETVASGFDSPRDVDFHPTPGLHLGTYTEGRTFHPSEGGDEAWVVNGGNHSISIVASLGTPYQTTLSRRDRGYYHYMMNGTALSFNKVKNSGRSPSRDSFNYWAICNDNTNTYVDTKEPNYFMGPTLYDSNPQNRNTVNRLGEECRDDEPCYFLHADMLHEAPACTGIVHDPEVATAYGTVYWAFDTTGNRQTGQLVRFDFQQPHGPGSMDHSIAAVRRYVEIELERGPPGVHSGMAVHPTRRELYVAVPGANRILVVDADSGSFARTAREEYPIFSNRLPSFEYSIWECVDSQVLDSSVDMPTGMALSLDGERLFVAERGTGNILVYDIASRTRLFSIPTQFTSIGGMAVSPSSGELYFVDDDTNGLYRIEPLSECSNPIPSPANPLFQQAVTEAQEVIDNFSLSPNDYYTCQVNPIVPDSSFFDQVHEDTGYADDNPNVQSNMTGMDAAAALLANRTDCGYDSDLNFDALLLGGYFCHPCLPEQDLVCDFGGTCTNVQWRGYVCDNDIRVITTKGEEESAVVELQTTDGSVLDSSSMTLTEGVTYRFTAEESVTLCAYYSSIPQCGTPLLLPIVKDVAATSVLFTLEDDNRGIMISFQLSVEDEEQEELFTTIGCFSATQTVELSDGSIRTMSELKIGDKVRVHSSSSSSSKQYEPIYSFGHYAPHGVGEFLNLNDGLLQVSPSHLVLSGDGHHWIPASSLKVGDSLVHTKSTIRIDSIRTIVRHDGLYAPFTPSGTIIVNGGIVASTFISLQENNEYLHLGKTFNTRLSFQWLAYVFESPHRLYSQFLSLKEEEIYNEDGISSWVALPHQIMKNWILNQGVLVQIVILVPVTSAFLLCNLVEQAFLALLWSNNDVMYNMLLLRLFVVMLFVIMWGTRNYTIQKIPTKLSSRK